MYDPARNRIRIDGYYDAIVAPTEEEEMLVATLITKFKDRAFASERENTKVWANNWSDEEAIRRLLFDTTLNIDGLWAGYTGPGVATILPEKAACKIDSRLVPNQVVKEQAKLIRGHLDRQGYSDIEMQELAGGDEWSSTSVTAPVVQAILSVYKRHGIEPAIWPRSAGSSPQAQYTREPLNLAAASGGLGHGGRAHSVDEYFVIEGNDKVAGLAACEKSIVDILYAYANWPE
jgi:acetylornithine deacetylase/succinyl-diaminopimelate desuccinylase-like protein